MVKMTIHLDMLIKMELGMTLGARIMTEVKEWILIKRAEIMGEIMMIEVRKGMTAGRIMIKVREGMILKMAGTMMMEARNTFLS